MKTSDYSLDDCINTPFTTVHEQIVSKHGICGKRKGMLYILMPKESIGKRYRITLEPLAGGE